MDVPPGRGEDAQGTRDIANKDEAMRLRIGAAVMLAICCSILSGRPLWGQTPKEDAAKPGDRKPGRANGEAFLQSRSTRKWQRKIVISPKAVTAGISNGSAIVYGHYLKPPFVVEVDGSRILLNGVQVSPSLVAQRESGVRQVSEEARQRARQQIAVEDKLRSKYRREILLKGKEQLQSDLAEYAKSFEIVEKAYWQDGNFLIKYSGTSTMILSLADWHGQKKRSGDEPPNKASLQAAELMRNILSRGDCLILSSEGMIKAMADPRERVVQSVESKKTDDMRHAALKEMFDSEDAASDVLENFDPGEWSPKHQ